MKYKPDVHHRKSIRLKGYNYSSPGVYFITICTNVWANSHSHIFGEIINGKMILTECGKTVDKCWREIPQHFPSVKLDEYVIMPNHIHGIIIIVGATFMVARNDRAGINPAPTLGNIIGSFKSLCIHKCIENRINASKLWQRNYYEHIIRNEDELHKVREYITNNPLKWELDFENPERRKDYKNFTDYLKERLK